MRLFNPRLVAAACLLSAPIYAQFPAHDAWAVSTRPAPDSRDGEPELADRTEYTRTVLKSILVDGKAALSIDNWFGDVSVSLWEKNEFRIQIVISASSKDREKASRALNAVQINESRDGNTILLKTLIDKDFEKSQERDKEGPTSTTTYTGDAKIKGLKTSWRASRKGSGTSLRITYRIQMPKGNGLTIKNSFGNTTIPDFWAPLSVSSRFGDVSGAALNSLNTKIKASFGNVTIYEMQNGHVNMSFGDLDIHRGNVLRIEQSYGKLNIGEINRVDAKTSYGRALIGLINRHGKFKINFAEQFQVSKIGPATEQVDVESNYSSVVLPMQSTPNCDFDVTVTNSQFSVPTLPNLRMLTPPTPPPGMNITGTGALTPPMPPRPARTRQYIGRMGNGEGPRIKVVAVYGDVYFNK